MIAYFAILPIINVFLCAGLFLFTLSRNPRHIANIGFASGMISLVILEFGNALLLGGNTSWMSHAGLRITLTGQSLLVPTWLLFALVFARANHKDILKSWLPVLIILSLLSVFFIIMTGSSEFISHFPSIAEREGVIVVGPVGHYFYIYLLIGLVLNIANFENTLRLSGGIKRRQIKYIIFGSGAILSFYLYLSSQILLFSVIDVQFMPVGSAVILLSAIIIAIFIVRYRLLDVDIFVSRYVVYNSFTVIIVGVYLLLVGAGVHIIRYFDIPFSYFLTNLFVFISVLSLVILLFSVTIRRKVQVFINRHFYKHKYEFRDKWMETTEKISSKNSIEEIEKTLKDMIYETMTAKRIYIWLYNPVSKIFRMTNDGFRSEISEIDYNHPLIRHIEIKMAPFLVSDMIQEGIQQQVDIDALVRETGTVLCAPLIADQEIIGFLLQSEDISGETYRQDDFELLKAITTHAAVQIKNIRLVKELMAIREVESFHMMSSFIMHDLKNLTNSLSLLSRNARYNIDNPDFQKDAIRTIDSNVSRMKNLIGRLSSIPREIELKKEKVEIVKVLDNAIKRVNMPNNDKKVIFINDVDDSLPIILDPEAIGMVFLNILQNGYEAIEKEGEIRAISSVSGEWAGIIISDNGQGMSKEFVDSSLFHPFKTTKKGGFGIGLYQCKSIVEAHGGRIDVQSKEGNGTTFTIKLPRIP